MPRPSTKRPTPPWVLEALHSHLYPGARLRYQEPDCRAYLSVNDPVIILFADQTSGMGTVAAVASAVDDPHWTLNLQGRTTAKGTTITAQVWRLEPLGDDLLRVRKP